MCSWAQGMPAHPKCVVFSNCVHWSNKRSDLRLAWPQPWSLPAPGASRPCVGYCLALPQRTCQAGSRRRSTPALAAGAYLPPNSMPAASTQPHGCFRLPVGSALADCREAEVGCGSGKHQGIRQDGCGPAGASLGAPGRRQQLVQRSILAGISPECGCRRVSCSP